MPEWPHVAAPPILDHFRTQSDISIYSPTRLSRLGEERLLGFEPADHGGSSVMNSADHCVQDRRLNPPANTQATFQTLQRQLALAIFGGCGRAARRLRAGAGSFAMGASTAAV